MHVTDFIIFIVFTLGVVLFGCSFFKKGSSADEFTSAGHSIPGWVVGMSMQAILLPNTSYLSIGIVVRCQPIPFWRRNSGRGHVFMHLHVTY